MNKKLISTIALSVVACAMLLVMTAFALPTIKADAIEEPAPVASIPVAPLAATPVSNSSEAVGCDFFSLMFDENGEPYSEEIFVANVDKAIADGLLEAEYKDFLLAMYGACAVESGGGMPCSPQGGGMMGMGGCPFNR